MIKTEQLRFQYDQSHQTFEFPDIALKAKEHLLIVGESGIGKTTLLHLMAGLLTPSSGKISIDGTDLGGLSNRQRDAFRGKQIGLVFQNNYAIQSLTVNENLKARLFFARKKIQQNEIDGLLEELGLLKLKNRHIKSLSQGQLQRLGIGLSVVHQPKVILADEPTSSLDDTNCRNVMTLLTDQAEKNKANLIVITHDHRIKSSFKQSIAL